MTTHARPPSKRKPGRQPRVDWDEGRRLYTTSLDTTYDDVAKAIGAHPSSVTKRAALEGWTGIREANRSQIVQESLRAALEDKIGGATALLHVEYQESLQLVAMLQGIRRQAVRQTPDGPEYLWSPATILVYAKAFREVTTIARLALGLPTAIAAPAAEQTPISLTLQYVPSGLRTPTEPEPDPAA